MPGPSRGSSPPPRSQAASDSPAQARHGLEKVQEQDDDPEPNERPRRLPGARDEIGTAGPDPCLRNEERNGDPQRRSDDQRGIPTHAQEERPPKKGGHQIPLRGE